MCDEFGEVSGIIDLVINFLAAGTLLLNSYDTLSYIVNVQAWYNTMPQTKMHRQEFFSETFGLTQERFIQALL